MTENKRFKNVEENLEWGTVQYFTYYDEKITDKELEKLVNHLLNQNDELNDENQKLDEKICSLTMDLIKTKSYEQLEKELNRIKNENEQLKEHLSTWRSSCCNYLNVYSILDNEVSILKETKDLDRFFEKFDKYSRMPFYEVEKSFIELQTENEQLKEQNRQLRLENGKLTHDLFWANKKIEEELR